MSFWDFIRSLPFPQQISLFFVPLILFLVGFGIYKFVKDWLPW